MSNNELIDPLPIEKKRSNEEIRKGGRSVDVLKEGETVVGG